MIKTFTNYYHGKQVASQHILHHKSLQQSLKNTAQANKVTQQLYIFLAFLLFVYYLFGTQGLSLLLLCLLGSIIHISDLHGNCIILLIQEIFDYNWKEFMFRVYYLQEAVKYDLMIEEGHELYSNSAVIREQQRLVGGQNVEDDRQLKCIYKWIYGLEIELRMIIGQKNVNKIQENIIEDNGQEEREYTMTDIYELHKSIVELFNKLNSFFIVSLSNILNPLYNQTETMILIKNVRKVFNVLKRANCQSQIFCNQLQNKFLQITDIQSKELQNYLSASIRTKDHLFQGELILNKLQAKQTSHQKQPPITQSSSELKPQPQPQIHFQTTNHSLNYPSYTPSILQSTTTTNPFHNKQLLQQLDDLIRRKLQSETS